MLTVIYAQILGIYLFVVSLGLLINPQKARALMEEAKHSKALIFFDGAIALFLGSIIVLSHNVWNSPFESAVSFLGWLMFVAGVFEIIMPHKVVVKVYSKFPQKAVSVFNVLFLILAIYMLVKAFGIA